MPETSPLDLFRERLSHLDTCVISDALDRLGLAGVVTGIQRLSTNCAIAGRVQTVKLEQAAGRVPDHHIGTLAIEAAQPGEVIVIEQRAFPEGAGWGGILSFAAKQRNVAGVIVDGPCRDIDESRRLDFPVFGRSVAPLTARGRVIESGFNVPVQIGSVKVEPGDWVVADGSGITFLAAENAARILAAAEELSAKERAMIQAVQAGQPVTQVMAGNYERMLHDE
jgi:4-hydroxy-4-methyl-2-oxoglutarate aldolase